MIIYNVTVKVSWKIHDAWLQWMKQEHIPDVLSTGCFHRHQLVRMLEVEEDDGATYAVQYYAHSKEDYEQYIEQHAPRLREDGIRKWRDQFVAFRSIMEIVN